MFLEKGVKVIRSSSEILTLIKSCDTSTVKNVSEDVQQTNCPTANCISPLAQHTQNVPKKLFKHLGPKRIFKPNVLPQISESKHFEETKDTVTQQSNSLKNKKLVSI